MALMNLGGYESPRYPEGPMTIAAIAQLLSSITGGIGDWQERKEDRRQFDEQMAMREALQKSEQDKYKEAIAHRDRMVEVPWEKGIGPTPEGGTVTHFKNIPASDYPMHQAQIGNVLDADERAQDMYRQDQADAESARRWAEEMGLKRDALALRRDELGGGASGDPMKMLAQLSETFGGYDKMTGAENAGPEEALSQLNLMVDSSNNASLLRGFMDRAESAPTKSHVSMLAADVRGQLMDPYDQQVVDRIEQFVMDYGDMPEIEGPSLEDKEALMTENDPMYPWRKRGSNIVKGLQWGSPYEIDPQTGQITGTGGESEWARKLMALLSGMGEGY